MKSRMKSTILSHRKLDLRKHGKLLKKCSLPWWLNHMFSFDAESLRGYVKSNMKNFLLPKMP
jgi:hypothetical protein